MKTRTSYVKTNSQTQQACKEKTDVVKTITTLAGITKDEWLHILFESGCRLMEIHVEDDKLRLELLTNIKHGFWSWWLWAFIQDDERMLEERLGYTIVARYKEVKMGMADMVQITGVTDFFIKETINDL